MDATVNIAAQELEYNISEEMEAPTLVVDAPSPRFMLAGAAEAVRSQRQQAGASRVPISCRRQLRSSAFLFLRAFARTRHNREVAQPPDHEGRQHSRWEDFKKVVS